MDVGHTRILQAHLLDSQGLAVELASRSLVRASSTALRHVRELDLIIVVAWLDIVQVVWCLTHRMFELHRLVEICLCFTSSFHDHVIPVGKTVMMWMDGHSFFQALDDLSRTYTQRNISDYASMRV